MIIIYIIILHVAWCMFNFQADYINDYTYAKHCVILSFCHYYQDINAKMRSIIIIIKHNYMWIVIVRSIIITTILFTLEILLLHYSLHARY